MNNLMDTPKKKKFSRKKVFMILDDETRPNSNLYIDETKEITTNNKIEESFLPSFVL